MDKPPRVIEAQRFIDNAWRKHLHDTEHVLAPDWQLGPETFLYNDLGNVVVTHFNCRFCRIDALTASLKPWHDEQSPPCECGDCDNTE